MYSQLLIDFAEEWAQKGENDFLGMVEAQNMLELPSRYRQHPDYIRGRNSGDFPLAVNIRNIDRSLSVME